MKDQFLPDLQETSLQTIEIAEFGDGDASFFGDEGEGVPFGRNRPLCRKVKILPGL